MEQIVYLNGSMVPRSEARISPFDFGYLYGYGLFESMRTYGGRVFRIIRHIDRLKRAADVLGMRLPDVDFEKAVYDTLRANNLSEARLRLAVSPGEGEAAPDPSTCKNPTVFISANAYTPMSDETCNRGFRAALSDIRRNSTSPLSQLKSANYLDMILARTRARNAGYDESLLLNDRGHLAEGSTSNVFIVSGGKIASPSVDDGILPGVTREAVLELASSVGIEAEERPVELEELYQADEAFLTNSVIGIMPLVEVDDRCIGSGSAGTITGRLMSEFKALIEKELGL